MKSFLIFAVFIFAINACKPEPSANDVVNYVDKHGLPNDQYDIYIFGETSNLKKNTQYEFVSLKRTSYIKYRWYFFDETIGASFSKDYSGKIADREASAYITFSKAGTFKVYLQLIDHDGKGENTTITKTVTVQ